MGYHEVLTKIINPELITFIEKGGPSYSMQGYVVDEVLGKRRLVKKFVLTNGAKLADLFSEVRAELWYEFARLDEAEEAVDPMRVVSLLADMFTKFLFKAQDLCTDKELMQLAWKSIRITSVVAAKLGVNETMFVEKIEKTTESIMVERRKIRSALRRKKEEEEAERRKPGLLERILSLLGIRR